jgi:uncharacterized membrane protein YbhN (UPF0104 family)
LLLYAAGTAIFLASVAYLAFRITDQWQSLESTSIQYPGWFAASAAVYAFSHITTALAWPNALRLVGDRLSLRDGLKIGLVAQVGKYLPGNVAHYVGRAALGKTIGISFRGSGISTLIEIACALIAALLLAPGVMLMGEASYRSVLITSGVIGLTTVAVVILSSLRRTIGKAGIAGVRAFTAATACLTVSLLFSGISAYCLLRSIAAPMPPLMYVVGSFALAWIVGFLTPGAPGGLGVRETVLISLLGSLVGAGPALACAILHRVITAAIDFAAGILGYAWLALGMRSKK